AQCSGGACAAAELNRQFREMLGQLCLGEAPAQQGIAVVVIREVDDHVLVASLGQGVAQRLGDADEHFVVQAVGLFPPVVLGDVGQRLAPQLGGRLVEELDGAPLPIGGVPLG